MCDEINAYFQDKRVPLALEYFSSLFRLLVTDDPYGLVRELLIILLKVNGIETSTSGNSFLNLTHTDADVRSIVDGFKRSVDTRVEQGFFHEAPVQPEPEAAVAAMAAPEIKVQSSPVSAGPVARTARERLKDLLLADLRSINGEGN